MGYRKLLLVALPAVCAFVTLTRSASSQEAPKPGAEHKVLEPMIGSWNAKVKMFMDPTKAPEEAEGKMTRKWIMNGLYMQEDFEGNFGGMDFRGMGITGYDVQKKKYVATWIDNMNTSIVVMDATFDSRTKTLSGTMEDIDPMTGKKGKKKDSVRIVDNDHQVQEMFMIMDDGKEVKMMEIHYMRAKK